MHGIIFTSFRQFLTTRLDPAAAAGAWIGEPTYSITASYPDDEFRRLFERVCAHTGDEPEALLREFGVFTGERTFVLLYPSFYDEAGDARTFLLGVEERIHQLIRAVVPEARPPRLRIEASGDDGVRISYDSPRRMCILLEGLLVGTARHYGQAAQVEEVRCMRRGDAACLFEARLAPNGA